MTPHSSSNSRWLIQAMMTILFLCISLLCFATTSQAMDSGNPPRRLVKRASSGSGSSSGSGHSTPVHSYHSSDHAPQQHTGPAWHEHPSWNHPKLMEGHKLFPSSSSSSKGSHDRPHSPTTSTGRTGGSTPTGHGHGAGAVDKGKGPAGASSGHGAAGGHGAGAVDKGKGKAAVEDRHAHALNVAKVHSQAKGGLTIKHGEGAASAPKVQGRGRPKKEPGAPKSTSGTPGRPKGAKDSKPRARGPDKGPRKPYEKKKKP